MKYKHGEYIYLQWEGRAPYEVVKGHVAPDAFTETVVRERDDYGRDARPLGEQVHAYARWACDATARENGWDSTFYVYQNPGRGRFAVTLGLYPNETPGFRDAEVSNA